jgi:hypothetical protein
MAALVSRQLCNIVKRLRRKQAYLATPSVASTLTLSPGFGEDVRSKWSCIVVDIISPSVQLATQFCSVLLTTSGGLPA